MKIIYFSVASKPGMLTAYFKDEFISKYKKFAGTDNINLDEISKRTIKL